MKKLNVFLLGLVSIGMIFTSCSDDETNEPPTIQVIEADGYVVDGDEVETSTAFKVKINGTANATSSAELVGLEVLAVFNNTTVADSTIAIDKQGSFAGDITFDAPAETGSGKITFTLVDKKDQTAEAVVNLTFVEGLSSQGTKQLGAGSNQSLGSYYSVADATVMSVSEAKASPNKVDFVFNSTATTASFFSPKDASATEISSTGRTTLYAKAGFDFASATIADISGVTLTADNVDVVQGDVVVYETADATKGVFEVTSLTVAADGSVTIDIKVK